MVVNREPMSGDSLAARRVTLDFPLEEHALEFREGEWPGDVRTLPEMKLVVHGSRRRASMEMRKGRPKEKAEMLKS